MIQQIQVSREEDGRACIYQLGPDLLCTPHVVVPAQQQRHGDERLVPPAADAQVLAHTAHVHFCQHALIGRPRLQQCVS